MPAPPAEAPAEDTVVTDAELASSSSSPSSSSSESSDSSSDSSSESESEEEPVLRMDEDVELNVPTNVNPAAPGPVTLVKNEQPEAQTKAAQAKVCTSANHNHAIPNDTSPPMAALSHTTAPSSSSARSATSRRSRRPTPTSPSEA